MTDNTEDSIIQLWNDPESKIRFLEWSLHGQEWQASIPYSPKDPRQLKEIIRIETLLKNSGYKLKRTTDKEGQNALVIHHLGEKARISKLLHEHGAVSGMGYMLQHPLHALKSVVAGTHRATDKGLDFFHDPAHANGLMFIAAEIALLFAGTSNRHGGILHPKNLLQSVAGGLWLSQSAAYLFLAEKGDTRIFNGLKKEISKSDGHLADFEQLEHAPIIGNKKPSNILSKLKGRIEDHPIEFGAIINCLGMGVFMAHAVLEKKFNQKLLSEASKYSAADIESATKYLKKGFKHDIRGALTSTFAWAFLLVPTKEHQEKAETGIGRLKQSFEENPQTVTGIMAIASSTQRLIGAIHKGNKLQKIGEALYIPGDLMLLFTKNNEYGNSRQGSWDILYDSVAQYINHLPIVTSPQSQNKFVEHVAKYLAKQSVALSRNAGEAINEAEEATRFEAEIGSRIDTKQEQRFDMFIGAANRLISRFPSEKRSNVVNILIKTLPELKGVEAEPETLRKVLHTSRHNIATPEGGFPSRMEEVGFEIADIVFAIPGQSAGNNAIILYEALKGQMRSTPNGHETLEQQMVKSAQQRVHGQNQDHAPQPEVLTAHLQYLSSDSPAMTLSG